MLNTLCSWSNQDPEYIMNSYKHTSHRRRRQVRVDCMIESTLTLAELARVWGDYWARERLQHTFSNTFMTPGDTPVESGEVGHWVASADDRPTTMGDLLQGSADPNR